MSSTVSFFAAKNIGEKEKLVNNSRGNQIWIFYYKQKIQKKLLAVKKNYPLNKKYTHFLRCMDKPFFFFCARMEKKSAIKETEFLP